jgi:hypothetical protein
MYETFNTHLCNGGTQLVADQETVFNAASGSGNNLQARPFGWTSADASGSSLYAGLLKYSEEAACVAAGPPYTNVPQHAIRYTMSQTANDSNGGQVLPPATHASGTNYNNVNIMGMRLRLQAGYNITGKSPINQCILNQMKQYGLILADNGGDLYFRPDQPGQHQHLQLRCGESCSARSRVRYAWQFVCCLQQQLCERLDHRDGNHRSKLHHRRLEHRNSERAVGAGLDELSGQSQVRNSSFERERQHDRDHDYYRRAACWC